MDIRSTARVLVGIVIAYSSTIAAYDTPLFYKPLLQVTDRMQTSENWVSTIDVEYGQGSGKRGWNTGAYRSSVLDIYGQTNITRLGVGLQNTTGMAVTNQYWKTDGTVGWFDYSINSTPTLPPASNGVVSFNGKISSNYLGLSFEQSIVAGFFARVYIPVRRVAVGDITYTSMGLQGANTVLSPASDSTGGSDITVAQFMTNVLPTILLENGFTNGWQGGFSKTVVPEAMVLLGWHGSNDKSFGVIDQASGRLQAGLIMPICGKTDPQLVFALPVGYDEMWGMHVRFDLEVGLWKKLSLGAYSALNVFLSDSQNRRVYTDYTYGAIPGALQQGWIHLQQARVDVNKGSMWDIACYAKGHDFFGGLVAQVGMAYQRQEATRLHDKSGTLLSRVVNAAKNNNPAYYISADQIINNDPRLGSWERCDMSLVIGYDFKKHVKAAHLAPMLTFEYAFPIFGKRAVNSSMFAGGLSIQIDMPF